IIILSFFVFGCSKKTEQVTQIPGSEEMSSEMEMETTSIQGTVVTQPIETLAEPVTENKATKTTKEVVKAQNTTPAATLGFVKPLTKDVQLALQNAGFYKGVVDGKTGPQTKSAIKEFQAKNGLKADGKIGPLTWEKLKVYLVAAETTKSKKAKH
ncbi:MAG: peptidoglycan-binding domain-containing protein, partial [Candidatus Omnitrophota bacterium]